MVSAIWKATTITTSDETVVNGNHYFSHSAVDQSLFEVGEPKCVFPVRGTARYFHVNDAVGQVDILVHNAPSSARLGPTRLQASVHGSLRGPKLTASNKLRVR